MDIPVTEKQDPRFRGIETLDTLELMRLINDEDARVAAAVRSVIPAASRVADAAAAGITRGGRLIYVGAGTSGRLGVLDAAECPPTYGVSPETVQGHIAGGEDALVHAAEGAEDDAEAGAALMKKLAVSPADTVIGISASGGARYVIAAVAEARRRGAYTAALTSNAGTKLAAAADTEIAVITGPEVVAGSTRMKCGTAQKLVLNMISTSVMVRLGHAHGGVMSGLRATNEKLRSRAVRIIVGATGAAPERAAQVLDMCGNDVSAAIGYIGGAK